MMNIKAYAHKILSHFITSIRLVSYKVLVFVIMVLCSVNLYAITCSMVNYTGGHKGRVTFKCDENISLKDNKLVFYIIGNDVEIKDILMDSTTSDYSIEEISSQIQKVSLNIFIKGWLVDEDFVANKDKQIRFIIRLTKSSNPNYKILWGGVVNNSYKAHNSKANKIQLHTNDKGEIYLLEQGLDCLAKSDSDEDCDEIYIDNKCSKDSSCKELRKHFTLKASLGLVHKKQI